MENIFGELKNYDYITMYISELIKTLKDFQNLYGDVCVEIYATTDDGYNAGGGPIQEINYFEIPEDSWNAIDHNRSKYILLSNYDG